jgi:hypothetical protein
MSITAPGGSEGQSVVRRVPKQDRVWLLGHTLKWCDGDEKAAKRLREEILTKAATGLGENPEGVELTCAIDWAVTWWRLQFCERNATLDGSTVRLDRARRMFQQATVTLARAKRLLRRPFSVQVNVATTQQVNNTV